MQQSKDCQTGPEIRKGLGDAGFVLDGLITDRQAGDREGHGDPMVVMRVYPGAVKRTAAVDGDRILVAGGICAHLGQLGHGHRQTVTLFQTGFFAIRIAG